MNIQQFFNSERGAAEFNRFCARVCKIKGRRKALEFIIKLGAVYNDEFEGFDLFGASFFFPFADSKCLYYEY